MRKLALVATLAFTLGLALALAPSPSRADPSPAAPADPSFDAVQGDNIEEDALADGDIDGEDRTLARASGRPATAEVHGESWVSLVGLHRELLTGKNDLGAMVVVGLALDRLAAGPVHRVADPPAPDPATAPARLVSATSSSLRSAPLPSLPPSLAHDCVAAAWRSSGIGADDSRLDDIVSRSRASALLPETRLRAMRLWDDANHTTTLATTDATNYYDAVGANLVLELRLTWRLDRLVYAGDEPTLERVRLERQDARARLATRTLDALFLWQRATLELRDAPAGSHEEEEVGLRIAQSEATLDVLTGGWFSDWVRTEPALEPARLDPEGSGR